MYLSLSCPCRRPPMSAPLSTTRTGTRLDGGARALPVAMFPLKPFTPPAVSKFPPSTICDSPPHDDTQSVSNAPNISLADIESRTITLAPSDDFILCLRNTSCSSHPRASPSPPQIGRQAHCASDLKPNFLSLRRPLPATTAAIHTLERLYHGYRDTCTCEVPAGGQSAQAFPGHQVWHPV